MDVTPLLLDAALAVIDSGFWDFIGFLGFGACALAFPVCLRLVMAQWEECVRRDDRPYFQWVYVQGDVKRLFRWETRPEDHIRLKARRPAAALRKVGS